MIGPYVLTFSPGVGLVSFFLGVLLMGVALSGSTRSLSVSAHAHFDVALGVTIFAIGILAGIMGEPAIAAIFLVGFGAAHLALTAATRYSARSA
jgi:predicted Na+-dependent transporter